MFGKETFRNLKLVFLCLFWVSVPLSISLSQILGGAALLFYLISLFWENPRLPRLFLWGVCLYVWILISGIFQSELSIPSIKKIILKTEFGDLWMYLLIPAVASFSGGEKNKIKRWIYLAGIILVIAGTFSLFFPYRLSTYVMDGFKYIEGKRLPHLIGHLPVLGTGVFLPIGFQNTHLTYGGLLALFLPVLFSKNYRCAKIYFLLKGRQRFYFYFYSFVSLSGLVLLFFNQSRSVWLGLILSFGFYLYSEKKLKSIFTPKHLIRLTIASLLFLFLLAAFYQKNWLFKRSIDQLFAKQTLENQRLWIHKGNFNILKNNPFLGVGSGNYTKEFEASYVDLVERKPYLYYEISITPKSHAHHDFLHFLILGGILGGIFYLLIWWEILKLHSIQRKDLLFFLGIYSFWIAGFFQCYLLDDEVLFPFLCLVAMMLPNHSNTAKLKFAWERAFFLFLPLCISLFAIFWAVDTKEEHLFLHRARDRNNFPSPLAQKTINGSPQIWREGNENSFYFKWEGCLNQIASLTGKNKSREIPFRFQIRIDSEMLGESAPESYRLEIRERESFDQDKHFKAHGERVIRILEGKFHSGQNEFIFPSEETKDKQDLYFIDFGMEYIWKAGSKEKSLPVLQISENCD
ncbi:O-antigen ligase domain-containing protein [Leptospira idonii]|uniref:O-antigen ligase domain-containing protein n=1 Tax=Leptospira idonii TaxID=1193500 RepID=A0A4R9LYF7_9LEPT|nr:O-antigen ligase domain-containing protein [Leptospira idonii]